MKNGNGFVVKIPLTLEFRMQAADKDEAEVLATELVERAGIVTVNRRAVRVEVQRVMVRDFVQGDRRYPHG